MHTATLEKKRIQVRGGEGPVTTNSLEACLELVGEGLVEEAVQVGERVDKR